jgi:hypothetical protein
MAGDGCATSGHASGHQPQAIRMASLLPAEARDPVPATWRASTRPVTSDFTTPVKAGRLIPRAGHLKEQGLHSQPAVPERIVAPELAIRSRMSRCQSCSSRRRAWPPERQVLGRNGQTRRAGAESRTASSKGRCAIVVVTGFVQLESSVSAAIISRFLCAELP